MGSNKDEGTLFHSSILSNPVHDETEMRAALMRRFADAALVDQIMALYPVTEYPSANDALAMVSGDLFFTCPARRNARAFVAAGMPVYRYVFERELEMASFPELHVFHSSEIPFVFGGEKYPLGKVGSATSLEDAMQSAWTGFAKTGDPGGWQPYVTATDPYEVLDVPVAQSTDYRGAFCDFWDTVPR
jgi:para-nitrobenzyl esterase